MSKLKNELTAIREALDTEHEYSGDYALQEEVANIRKLVENGAGSGGGNFLVTQPNGWYLDKTWNEIASAARSGKNVVFVQDTEYGVNVSPLFYAVEVEDDTHPYVVGFYFMPTSSTVNTLEFKADTPDEQLSPVGLD